MTTHATIHWNDAALIAREVERCGWTATKSGLAGERFELPLSGLEVSASVHPYRNERSSILLVVDLGAGQLPTRRELFIRYLDFSIETRMILDAARKLAGANFLILLSDRRIELYSTETERLIEEAHSAREFEEGILPALIPRAAGSSEIQRALLGTQGETESLGGWLRNWAHKIGSHLEIAIADVETLIWKIILMLQLDRTVSAGHSQTGHWGLRREQTEQGWRLSYDALSARDDLRLALETFDQTFSSRIFSGDAELHNQWFDALEETSLVEQFRTELLMLARFRFSADQVAWLFTNVEREQEGWRREVSGLTEIRKRLISRGWQVFDPLVADLAAHGLTSVLREADRVAEHWHDYAAYRRRIENEGRADAAEQPDLFLSRPRGVNERDQLVDPINFIFEESFRVGGVTATVEFSIGLCLLLKSLEWAERFDWPFAGVDALDRIWQAGKKG